MRLSDLLPGTLCRRHFVCITGSAQKTTLTVYTALETDQLKAYEQEGFKQAHPDIEIKWVRDSTGVVTAKS